MGATIGTRLMTWLRGEPVGEDHLGNRYYKERSGKRRWVIYKGEPAASSVPPEWHAWLHRTTDQLPRADAPHHAWEREHVANLSGTPEAYRPAGSLHRGGQRPHATGDYEPWQPG